jgi:hypothetical protein
MMKKMTMFEVMVSPEQQLVKLLKEKGPEDTEFKETFTKWTIGQEQKVEKSSDYKNEQIHFNIRRARIYFEAGYLEDAFESFENARTQAWNEQFEELYKSIMDEMDRLGL